MVFRLTLATIFFLALAGPVLAGPGEAASSEGILRRAGEYEAIRESALSLLDQYPTREYLYVGIGRSPTPIFAMLEALGLPEQIQIPGSNLRILPYAIESNDVFPGQLRGAALRERFHAHVASYLPPGKVGKKKILLIDFAESGDALKVMSEAVRTILASHGVAADRVVPLVLEGVYDSQDEGMREAERVRRYWLEQKGIQNVLGMPSPLGALLMDNAYDEFSRVPRFDLSDVQSKAMKADLSAWEKLKKLLRNRIQGDETLRCRRVLSHE